MPMLCSGWLRLGLQSLRGEPSRLNYSFDTGVGYSSPPGPPQATRPTRFRYFPQGGRLQRLCRCSLLTLANQWEYYHKRQVWARWKRPMFICDLTRKRIDVQSIKPKILRNRLHQSQLHKGVHHGQDQTARMGLEFHVCDGRRDAPADRCCA